MLYFYLGHLQFTCFIRLRYHQKEFAYGNGKLFDYVLIYIVEVTTCQE
nr:MAG TPA: Paratox [Caudoviricetes sp.]